MDRTGVRGFDSLSALLAGSDADAVVLCTPSGLHAEETVQAAAAGRHVITEKPMATRWEDGRRMVQACDRAGVRLFVVKQNRRNPTLQLLKRAVDGGRFGRIHAVQVNVFWNRPQSYYDSAAWRGTWEFDGGALMNQASHYIDLLEWLIGPVESVHAFTATLARNIQVEDSGVAVLRKVSKQLVGMTHRVEVQGHTDDVPLSPALASRWGTNWELAAARAASVVRLFENEGVDPRRLTVVSHGEFAPVASNDTPEGRAYNRRIEIRLIPLDAAESEVPADGASDPAGGEAPPAP